jgi:hypothetical protein
MYGVKIWGLKNEEKETDKIQHRFCKTVIRIRNFAANGAAEMDTGRHIRL